MTRACAIAVALAACATPIARPSTTDVARAARQRPQTTLAELEHGRSIYLARCGGCHRAYQPSHLTPAAWPAQVDEMAERAKLGFSDRELVVLFLVTMSRS